MQLRVSWGTPGVITKSYGVLGPKDGEVVMDPFEFDASELGGRTLVVTEVLLDYESKEVIVSHEDLSDEGQSIHFPEIQTTALADDTKDHVTKAGEKVTITDTVEYRNLLPGKTYVMKGVLVDRSNGQPILIDGKEITSKKELTPEKADGSVDMAFTFDASAMAGTTTVVFENLYYNGVEAAVHTNLSDEGQTVYIPEIETSVTDSVTGLDHTKADEEAVIIDTVTYKGLCPGKAYVMKGVLVDKKTGEAVLNAAGESITAEQKFTPEGPDGTVEITFTFDAFLLKGETVVAFERCYYNGIEVAVHADIEDEDQTDYIPEIHTTAAAKDTADHMAEAGKAVTITDTVSFTGLKPHTKYELKGFLVNSETGKLLDIKGSSASVTLITGDLQDGTVEMSFTIDASSLAGKTVVVFEELYRKGRLIASHADVKDEGQTIHFAEVHTTAFDNATENHDGSLGEKVTIRDHVYFRNLVPGKRYKVSGKLMDREQSVNFIEIRTTAKDKATGSKTMTAQTEAVLTDTVSFKGLTPGKEYILKGEIMDQETGEGIGVTAEARFSPEASEGETTAEFTLNTETLRGRKLVVFEKLYDAKGNLLAEHADLNDEGQTVTVPEKPETPETPPTIQTGDHHNSATWILLAVGTIALLAVLVFIRKRDDWTSRV